MTTEPSAIWEPSSDRHTRTGKLYSEAARDHLWMHFTRHSVFEDPGSGGTGPQRPHHHPGRGLQDLRRPRQRVHRRPRRALRQPGGHGRTEIAEAMAKQAARARLLPAVVLRPPPGHRARRAPRGRRTGRPQPGLLHDRRRRGRRDRLEARQAVLQARRQADEAQGHQPLGRLPRHPARRPVDHRHPGRQGDLRAARAGRLQGAEHELLPGAGAPARRREGLRPLGRRPDRRGHRVRGSRHRRRRLPRAGPELRRLLPAAARLLRPGPRDLRRVRRAPRLRRDDLRVRPDRLDVRLRRLRLRARHHHDGQGRDLRLRPARADDRQRPAVRAVPARARRTSRTATRGAATR